MLEDGKLDSRPAPLPEKLEKPTVNEIGIGSAFLVDTDAIWVLEDGSVYLEKRAPLTFKPDEWETYVQVIGFEEGLVIDTVSGEHKKPTGFARYTAQELAQDESYDPSGLEPVVGWVTTAAELQSISQLFLERYGRPLTQEKTQRRNRTQSKPPESTTAQEVEEAPKTEA